MPISKRTACADFETGVYCWRNRINGKVYVGSASLSLEGRKKQHLSTLHRGVSIHQHLQHAWNKYGEDSFDWVVLERCPPEECIKREQYWIDERRAVDPKYGYNTCPTAGSCLGVKRSDEIRAKISATSKKIHAKPEVKARHSAAMKEACATSEAKARMSATAKKIMADPELKAKHSAAVKKACTSPEGRARLSAAAKIAHVKKRLLVMEARLLGVRQARRRRRQ